MNSWLPIALMILAAFGFCWGWIAWIILRDESAKFTREMKTCYHCGKPHFGESKFCDDCRKGRS